jgi:hypothetical protein
VESDLAVIAQRAANKPSPKSSSVGSGQATVFMRPSSDAVNEQWARALVKKGLAIDLVDDVEFRKAILLTARAGLSYVDAQKAESYLPHRTKMSTGFIPELDVKLHEKMSKRIYGLIKQTGMSAAWLLTDCVLQVGCSSLMAGRPLKLVPS